ERLGAGCGRRAPPPRVAPPQQDPRHGGDPRGLADVRRRVPAADAASGLARPARVLVRHPRRRPGRARHARLPGGGPRARGTDVVIVGSGPGGVNAAAALVAAGRRVLLLDYGNEDRRYAGLVPHRPFSEIRRTDPAQHRYFLGDRFEGIPFAGVRVGAHLTPPPRYVLPAPPPPLPLSAHRFPP